VPAPPEVGCNKPSDTVKQQCCNTLSKILNPGARSLFAAKVAMISFHA
jgi:hypothetical protein